MLKSRFVLNSIFAIFICISLFSSCTKSFPVSDTIKRIVEDKNNSKVFLFWDTECPLCLNYSKDIAELQEEYKRDSVKFYWVFQNKVDTGDLYFRKIGFKPNILIDSTKGLTKILKATVTPQVYVINKENELVYSGKIDNWIVSLGQKRQQVDSFYLKDALFAIKNETLPSISTTTPIGCFIEQ